MEILALATFEGVPLPDDLVADEYERHGWLATGRDIADEGFCHLTDAGRDLIGTVLAEAATSPSEQGGEARRQLDEAVAKFDAIEQYLEDQRTPRPIDHLYEDPPPRKPIMGERLEQGGEVAE